MPIPGGSGKGGGKIGERNSPFPFPSAPAREFTQRKPRPPRNFTVRFDPDGISLLLSLNEPVADSTFPNIDEYRFYFAPITVASPSAVATPDGAHDAFKLASIIGSIPATNKTNHRLTWKTTRFYDTDGWWWCPAVSIDHYESNPGRPVRAPSGTAGTAVPTDVTAPTAVLSDATVEGRAVKKLSFSAVTPNPTGTFAGYQLYLDNYIQAGVGVRWESVAVDNRNQAAGTTLSGNTFLYPDAPPNHAVRVYFVAYSNDGTRANPITGPNVLFATGIQ